MERLGSRSRKSSLEMERLEVEKEFSGIQLVSEGWFARVYSAYHHDTDARLALKCVHKENTRKRDFLRELRYNYYLSPHPNVVTSFKIAYDTSTSYVFVQELAPEGDLSRFIKKGGLEESRAKKVAEQVAFALEFMHSKEIVHRDVRPENILAFEKDLSRVKLTDFGQTQRAGVLVRKANVREEWCPPEVCEAVFNEGYEVETSQDAWQLGILIFLMATGTFPWDVADITDTNFNGWTGWLKKRTTKPPPRFRMLAPRLLRLLKRLLEPKAEKRADVEEVYKYLADPWIVKESTSHHGSTIHDGSSLGEPERKVSSLQEHSFDEALYPGISAMVDDDDNRKRLCQWILTADNYDQKSP